MQYIFATAVILCFFAAITAFSFFATYALFLTFFSIFFADFTTSSSNNFDLSAIYTSTISLISLWLVFYYCLSVCRVMGIGIRYRGGMTVRGGMTIRFIPCHPSSGRWNDTVTG